MMIIFWGLVGLLTLISLWAVLSPLLRPSDGAQSVKTADYDVEVYKSQIREIDRDLAQGHLKPEEAEAARAEIGRRLLQADQGRSDQDVADGSGDVGGLTQRLIPYGVALLVPIVSFGLYLELGQPGASDQPLSKRSAEIEQARTQSPETAQGQSLDQAVLTLRQQLATDPNDINGWVSLAQMEMARRQYDEAVAAFERARVLAPSEGRAALTGALAEALTLDANGIVTERAQRLFQQAREADPDDLRADYYLAEADYQAGRLQEALEQWITLSQKAPADAAYLPAVNAKARTVADELDVRIEDRLQNAQAQQRQPNSPAPSKTQPDDENRRAMIEDMVTGLAARLEKTPNDLEGWKMLARSYMVLDRRQKALDALNKAQDLASQDVNIMLLRARIMRNIAGQSNTAQSIALMQDVLAIESENVEANWFLGQAEIEKGNRETAAAYFDQALEGLAEDTPERAELSREVERLLAK